MSRTSSRTFREAMASLTALTEIPDLALDCTFDARQPSLATRFRAGEAAAAALAGSALLARHLGEARGGPAGGRVRIGSRPAEASLLSFAYLRFADPERAPAARLAPEERTAAAGFHRSADGRWIYLHAGFPHNTRGILQLLGVDDDRRAVARAVATRDAAALERDLAAAGLCGAMVRAPGAWDDSAAGRLLASRPVVDVVQIGDAPPEPLADFSAARTPGARPLQGVRVLDLTRVLAGPTCARTLASYGAEALRVGARALPTIPLFVADTGFGKRNTDLDLRSSAGARRLRALVRQADVFSQGYRSGAMERLGFGPMEVARQRPGIVYVSINCYGHEGAWRTRPGWEQLAQSVTGMAQVHGADTDPDGPPVLLPAAVNDYITGYLAAFGVLTALARRARLGGSYWVRVSLARTAMWVRGLGLRRAPDARPVTAPELDGWLGDSESAWGPVRYLRPAVDIDTFPPCWALPPAAPGSHPPRFEPAPDRGRDRRRPA